jgi:hypothetical protein
MSWTESNAAHKLIRSKNKKQRDMARKSSIKSKASRMTQKDAEMTPDIMDYPGLPVVPDSYGTNSALESGQGVPQWYGSAENRQPPWSSTNPKPNRRIECGVCDARGFIAGKECTKCDGAGYWNIASPRCATCDTDIQWTDGAECDECDEWYCDNHLTEDGGCKVCGNTSLSFHAESFDDIKTASDLVEFAESNGGSLDIEIADTMADSEYISFVKPDAEAMDFVFLDGTMATCNKDDDLNTFVVAYEGETFEAMASHDPSGDDRDDAKAQFKMTYPGFTMSNSSLQYLIYQSGSSNKYHMFWLAQDKSGGWYAFSGYGRIGYAARMVRITGPTTQETAMRAMQSKINKKVGKGYTNVSRDFGMNAEESGKFMTFGEISYQYEYEDPSDGPLDSYDVQSIQRAVEGYISDDGGRDGEGVFAHYASDNDIVISVSWTHKYSGINSAEEVQAGLPVIPDSYGTNSALSSGQGVPQWYGSAEHHMTLSDLSDTPFGAFVKPDGTVIMVISDKSVKGKEQEAIDWGLNHFGKQYEGVKFVRYGGWRGMAEDIDWDRTEYEYKELEIAKPFRTAFMASLGFVVAPLALLAGLAFAFGDE